jgi:phosphopantetheine adenylyltransferase
VSAILVVVFSSGPEGPSEVAIMFSSSVFAQSLLTYAQVRQKVKVKRQSALPVGVIRKVQCKTWIVGIRSSSTQLAGELTCKKVRARVKRNVSPSIDSQSAFLSKTGATILIII